VSSRLRLAFAGTPAFAATCLEALVAAGWAPCVVYAQPDRPVGRGQRIQHGAVKSTAIAHGLPVEQPERLSSPEGVASLRAQACDVLVVVAYGQLLSEELLATPRLGTINVHASLLPRWRGAAPIERAIWAGDDRTGVSIMQVERRLDAGPVFLARTCSIGPNTTAGELHDQLADLGADALIETLGTLADGTATATPQDEAQVTYAQKLSKAEALIDWTAPCEHIDRCVRAFNPRPVAHGMVAGLELRIWRAQPAEGMPDLPPGQHRVIDGERLLVGTGTRPLELLELQAPGKRALATSTFLRGHSLPQAVSAAG
jgi:methionyl-tRNA formyltransferase